MNSFKSLKKLKLDINKIQCILLVIVLIIFIICCVKKKKELTKNKKLNILNTKTNQLDFVNKLLNLTENFKNY